MDDSGEEPAFSGSSPLGNQISFLSEISTQGEKATLFESAASEFFNLGNLARQCETSDSKLFADFGCGISLNEVELKQPVAIAIRSNRAFRSKIKVQQIAINRLIQRGLRSKTPVLQASAIPFVAGAECFN